MTSRWISGLACLVVLGSFGGCQTMSPSLVPCPMPVVEQAAKVQELVPLGTPRDQAISKLKSAGIDGNFGTANSIYYCDTWKQSDKERWHISVELLFDEQGKVYAYRPDPQSSRQSQETAGSAKVTKPARQIAKGPKPSVVDPFAE